jgi:hypothetical protein
VSTSDTSSNGHKAAGRPARDIREQNRISQAEAVAIAEKQIDFEPSRHQIRYLPQGLPPVYYWAVNFSKLDENGQVVRTEVVLVNANTGAVAP